MKRVALAALAAGGLWAGTAAASITLDLTFADAGFGVSGTVNTTVDSIPDGLTFIDAATANCVVTGPYTCDAIILASNNPGFEDGIQINLDNLDGSGGPGLGYSFVSLSTPGTQSNENNVEGHTGTLKVTNSAVPGVPEPAAWAMLLAGFFGVGGLLRQRRTSAAAAA